MKKDDFISRHFKSHSPLSLRSFLQSVTYFPV